MSLLEVTRDWNETDNPENPQTWQRLLNYDAPRLVYLLPDDELPEILRKARPNDRAPMTAQLITAQETFPFTKQLQEFLYRLNPNVPRSSFGALFYTWFPGGQGPNIGDENFVTDPNYTGEKVTYHAHLTLAGNTYLALGAPFMRGNTMVYKLSSIDVTKPLPEIVPSYQMTYLTIWSAGKVIRFPQGNGNDSFTALLSYGDLFIDARRVREVLFPPSPYRW